MCPHYRRMEGALRDTRGRPLELAIEVHTSRSPADLPDSLWQFPNPLGVEAHGFVGYGADFAPSTIVAAYRRGIFPWPREDAEFGWFSPHPRAVIPLDGLHISRRLARTLRGGRFRFTVDAAFGRVIRSCATEHAEGTWITERLLGAYRQLHALGWAHSVEVWSQDGKLAGGLYGLAVGAMFGAESMFHRQTDASKAAMVALVQHARMIGVQLLDVQVLTDHTARMGAVEVSRKRYLAELADAIEKPVNWLAPE